MKIPINTFYLKEHFPELHQHKEHLLNLINQAKCDSNEPIKGMDSRMPHTAKISPISRLDWNNGSDYKNRPWVNFVADLMITKFNSMLEKNLGLTGARFKHLWFQQYIQNDSHQWHIHESNFTGVYYVELNDEENNKTELISGDTKLTPEVKEGDICIFPSFVIHRCPLIQSTKRKTIISYNFDASNLTEHQFNSANSLK